MESRSNRVVEWEHEHCLDWMFEAGIPDVASLFLGHSISGRDLIHFATPLNGRHTLSRYLKLEGPELDQAATRLQSAFRTVYLPNFQASASDSEVQFTDNVLEPREYSLESLSHGEDGMLKHYKCGYCGPGGQNSNYCMEKGVLTIHQYEELKDLCWSRSGYHIYRPVHQLQCCPHYQIRVPVDQFKRSKKQERVWRKMQDFLAAKPESAEQISSSSKPPSGSTNTHSDTISKILQKAVMEAARNGHIRFSDDLELESLNYSLKSKSKSDVLELSSGICLNIASSIIQEQKKRQITELDQVSSLAKHLGAVLISILKVYGDNTASKGVLTSTGHLLWSIPTPKVTSGTPFVKGATKQASASSSVPKNELITSFHRPQFDQEVFELYTRYQAATHDDHDKKEEGYIRFLIDSPLKPEDAPEGSILPGYGTWHMHYRLNGTLVAVAVLDILPKSIVSVYFFWDRSLEHLNFGTYSALNELEFARAAGIQYYYLGWYVHTSKKMNYKSSFQPTEILCPDTLQYVPLDSSAREKLDLSGYARLDAKGELHSAPEAKDLHHALIKYLDFPTMPFGALAQFLEREEMIKVMEILRDHVFFLGSKHAKEIVLIRN